MRAPIAAGQQPPLPSSSDLSPDVRSRLAEAARNSTLEPWQRDFMLGVANGRPEGGATEPSPAFPTVAQPSGRVASDDGAWIAIPPPSDRDMHSAIYDPVRDRMVVFGGYDGSYPHRNDVWVLSLSGSPVWSVLAPAGTLPAGRFGHTAIYDPVRDRMVVFGGWDGGYRNDVWALSLSGSPAWSALAPAGTPPTGRYGQTAIYDPVRDRMVVFGGAGGNPHLLWALSLSGSTAWSELTPAGTPPTGRYGHTAIYDPVRDRMVVFGGLDNGYRNDVWALSLSGSPAWSALAPAGTPPTGRSGHTAIYDPVRDRMVVYGGEVASNSYRFDVWVLSLSGSPAWSALAPAGTPPAGRSGHRAIYDPARDRMVAFGGSGAIGYLNDVWALSLSGSLAWSALTPAGNSPPARYLHTAIYDPVRDRMVVFGGFDSDYRNDVWALSLSGSPAWSELAPTGAPPAARWKHTAIYDPVRDRMVVFGGANSINFYLNDAWTLTLSGSPAWSALTPAGTRPSPRRSHSAIYDPVRDRMVVFGGWDGVNGRNDAWALSLAGSPAWSALAPTGSLPTGRSSHTAIYDPVRDRMVVFAGDGCCFEDVWALSLSGSPGWNQLTPAGTSPPARSSHTSIYDPVRDRMVVFGGFDGTYRNDVWALSLSGSPGWSELTPAGTSLPARSSHTSIYDPVRDRMVVFGGYDGSYPNHNDAWALGWGQGTKTITASAGPGGAISPSGTVSVTYGHNQAFTIVPDACHTSADVLVDGVSVGAVGSYTFTNVQANHSIVASFTPGGPGLPAALTGLTVTNTGTSHSLDLRWDPSSSPGVTGYIIYRAHDGATDPPVSVTGPPYIDDAPLTRDTTYTYQVAAVSACGAGPPSASVSRAPDYFPVLLVHGICGTHETFTDCPVGPNGRLAASCSPPEGPIRLGDALVQGGIRRVYAFDYEHNQSLNLVAPRLSQKITDVLAQEGDPRLTIIAHSQGGLISRWAIQRIPGCSSRVADLIMIGTPNHGSELANYLVAQPALVPLLRAPWVSRLLEGLGCLAQDPATYNLVPGSWFLNQLNYRDDHSSYDSLDPFLLCSEHAPEEVSGSTRYWILAGSGGWCGLGTALGDIVHLCRPHDGVVSEKRADLVSVPNPQKASDEGMDPGGAYNRATHFGGSEGSCNIEEVRHPILISAVYNILTTGQIPSAPSAELLAAKPTSDGLMSLTASGADTIPQQITLSVSSIAPGETRTDQVQVDDVLEAEFVQSWETDALTLGVRTPQGALITPADAGTGGVSYEADPTLGYQVLTISNPSPGIWTVESTQSGGGAQQSYSVEAYVRAGAKLIVGQPAETGQGGVVLLTASLQGASGPMSSVQITGLAHDPGGIATPIQFFDDGQHGDGLAGDGVFGGTFSSVLAAGYYPVEINAAADPGGASQILRRWVGGFLAQSRPDLSVISNDVVVTRSRHGAPPESLEVTAKVHNLGSAVASGAVIAMAESGHPAFNTATVTLDPSGAATVTANWNPSSPDADTLLVYVDSASPFGQARYDNDTARVVIQPAIVAVEPVQLPAVVSLSSGYPNPSGGEATIEFELPRAGKVSLRVYDVAGRLVKALVEGTVPPGTHFARWDGRRNEGSPAASGVYFYELRADGRRLMRRLLILR